MSCRSTPAGSLATTFIARRYGLHDGQCTSIFHELMRGHSAGRVPDVTEEHFLSAINLMETQIRAPGGPWTDALRARALHRVTAARDAGMPSGSLAAAFVHAEARARSAQLALNALFQRVADLEASTAAPLGLSPRSPEEMAREFSRLYEQHNARLGDFDASVVDGLPGNAATQFAATVMLSGLRCLQCGQFKGPEGIPHECPVFEHEEEGSSFRQVLRRLRRAGIAGGQAEPDEAPDAVGEEAAAPGEPVPEEPAQPTPPEPWDMEDFQRLYDEMRQRIDAGDYSVPVDLELEKVPGGVTGGLGAREGGTSFGLELEIDFPDDDYPFSARYELARRLHGEGISQSPDIERWHFVGDGDRPGGDYTHDPNGWVCEFDRSVDDCDGERGVEVKSQILFDEPRTWENVRRICEIAEELGGRATVRTGLHVNVGANGFDGEDPRSHNSLLRLASAMDDTLIRLAHNPLSSSRHRGRNYCAHVHVPPTGFTDVATARAYSNHYQAFNLGHLPAKGERGRHSSRIEVRLWDSTLDPGRIQAAVTASLAIARHGALRTDTGLPAEPAGSHREAFGTARLEGEQWEESTLSFRRFVTLVGQVGASTEHHRRALTAMFAASRWPSR